MLAGEISETNNEFINLFNDNLSLELLDNTDEKAPFYSCNLKAGFITLIDIDTYELNVTGDAKVT